MRYHTNGYTVLDQFRQIPQTFGRSLLGLLLFVWLSMALSPCVMANSIAIDNDSAAAEMAATEMMVLHTNMEPCSYCPDAAMNAELCQNIHHIVSDSMVFTIDSIDTQTFILFEILATSSIAELTTLAQTINTFKPQNTSDKAITPLALTGILRI